jgi:N-acyl-D-aspartate/D-glutamate deacylase
MTEKPDIVIRGGTIADGRGGELFDADIAIKGGRIAEVGKISVKGKDEIDARGKLVSPGFVDVHTHYDGQVTWSQDITPSHKTESPPRSWAIAGWASRRAGRTTICG